MKTLTTFLAIAGAVAVTAPALADTAATPTAEQQCRTERGSMGATTFAQTYGTNHTRSNAFGKCVSKRARATNSAQTAAKSSAAKQCKAEQAADPTAFTKKYGSGKGANAYGRCVSTLAKQKSATEVKAEMKDDVSAAKACRTERAADKAAFVKKYGKNGSGANAFGKCVSTQAKARAEQRQAQQS